VRIDRRRLTLGLTAALVLTGLVAGSAWTLRAPLADLDQRIAAAAAEQQPLAAHVQALSGVDGRRRALVARTLAPDPDRAERIFRADMHRLLEGCGLRDVKVSPQSHIVYRNGSVGTPLTLSATGTLDQVVDFLCGFYQRDYIARLDRVRLVGDQRLISQVNSERGLEAGAIPDSAGAESGPELKVTMTAVALALPGLARLEGGAPSPADPRPPLTTLPRAPEDYDRIVLANPFRPYQPAGLTTVRGGASPAGTDITGDGGGKLDVRPPGPSCIVKGTTRLNGELIAYVRQEVPPARKMRKVRLDDQLDDGRVILIHPRGLVVRVTDDSGVERDYFYRLGCRSGQRQRLDREAHPEVWRALHCGYLS
jgi:hypothetical protein